MSEDPKKIKEIIDKGLQKFYEDKEVEVYVGLSDDTIKKIILEYLRYNEMSFSALIRKLAGITGKDRARKLLGELIDENKVVYDPETNKYKINDIESE